MNTDLPEVTCLDLDGPALRELLDEFVRAVPEARVVIAVGALRQQVTTRELRRRILDDEVERARLDYPFEGGHWIDSLVRRGEGWRLVRAPAALPPVEQTEG